MTKVIHFRKFDPNVAELSQLDYLLFGKGDELFLAHSITKPPDFDQVLFSKAWLLANNARSKPLCQRDPAQAFSKQVFEMVRAEIERERTSPGELIAVCSYVEHFCAELRGCASTAVKTGETTYFYYKVREFLSELAQRWPGLSPDGLTAAAFARTMEEQTNRKARVPRKLRASAGLWSYAEH